MLNDKELIQLTEATRVRVLMCPASIVIPFNMWEKMPCLKYTELVCEGDASTLSQLHANEMVHHLLLNEYGNPDLEPDSHSDQILSQFWRCDDDDED